MFEFGSTSGLSYKSGWMIVYSVGTDGTGKICLDYGISVRWFVYLCTVGQRSGMLQICPEKFMIQGV